MHAWRLFLAALVIAGLGAGLVYVVLTDGEIGDPVPTLATAVPTAANPTPGATVTLPAPASSSTTAVPSAVVVALRDALTAWGEFAVTGRIRDLGDHFAVGGPQKRRLRAEAESIRADPPGPPPYRVTPNDILTISVTPSDVVLRTEIGWAREGEQTQVFVWDIQMQLVEGMWQLVTVEEVAGTAER
ncbi:hypothetical protein ACFLRH_00870 [Actinomycetota bacterium]